MKLNLLMKITLFIVALIITCVSVLGFLAIRTGSVAVLEEVELAMQETAKEGAKYISAMIEVRLGVMTELAAKVSNMPLEGQLTALEPDVKRLGFLDLAVVDTSGTAHYSLSKETSDLSSREYIKKALNGQASVSDVLISKVTNSPVVMYAVPLFKNGQVAGALIGRREGTSLSDITNNMGIGENGYAYIMGIDGTLFAHRDSKLVLEQRNIVDDIENNGEYKAWGLAVMELGLGKDGIIRYELMGQKRMVAMQTIPETNWVLGFAVYEKDALGAINQLSIVLILISLAIVFIGIVAAILFTRSITKPIIYLVGKLNKMSGYDLRDDQNERYQRYSKKKDEIGVMARSVQQLQSNLKMLVEGITTISGQVAASSEELTSNCQQSAIATDEVAKSIQEIARGATEQACETEKGVSEIDELGRCIEQEQLIVIDLNRTADEMDTLKSEGFQILEVLIEKTESNEKTTDQVRNLITESNESARKIEQASDMIRSIAEQTNLLALNAAIEAARAGESGQGFAVVAEEIRKLAEQSKVFTAEIAKVIKDLTSKTSFAVSAMVELSQTVVSQTESVDMTSSKFEGIAQSIEKVKNAIEELNQSGALMSEKRVEIIDIIGNLSAVSEENAAGTQQASASIQELSASTQEIADGSEVLSQLAEEMQIKVSKFQL